MKDRNRKIGIVVSGQFPRSSCGFHPRNFIRAANRAKSPNDLVENRDMYFFIDSTAGLMTF